MMTEFSEQLSIVMSENGRRSYFFETPLLEGYTLAQEPYREFRRGIKITTYRNDSLTEVDAVLTANYAIYYEERGLWEARSNVEVHKYDGTEVYTQQLFWNTRTKKIYSNVDTKLIQGNNVTIGESFESDEDFKDWRFRYQKSRMEVDVTPSEGDTTRTTTAPQVTPAEPITYGERANRNEPSKARQPQGEKRGAETAAPARRVGAPARRAPQTNLQPIEAGSRPMAAPQGGERVASPHSIKGSTLSNSRAAQPTEGKPAQSVELKRAATTTPR